MLLPLYRFAQREGLLSTTEEKSFSHAIEIDLEGRVRVHHLYRPQVQEVTETDGRTGRPRTAGKEKYVPARIVVPYHTTRRNTDPHALWGGDAHVLGVRLGKDAETKKETATAGAHAKFLALAKHIAEASGDEVAAKVVAVLSDPKECKRIAALIVGTGRAVSNLILVHGGHLSPVVERPAVAAAVREWLAGGGGSPKKSTAERGLCPLTGEVTELARKHGAVFGIPGTGAFGAKLVSTDKQAFQSYGEEDYPISVQVADGYVKALERLVKGTDGMGKDRQAFLPRVKPRGPGYVVVYWSEGEDQRTLNQLIAEGIEEATESIQETALRVIQDPDVAATGCHVAALRGGKGRISVLYHRETTVGEIARAVTQYLDDTTLITAQEKILRFPLWQLLSPLNQPQGKEGAFPHPKVVAEIHELVLFEADRPLPADVLQKTMKRVQIGYDVTPQTRKNAPETRRGTWAQIALLKTYFNRLVRHQQKKGVRTVMPEEINPTLRSPGLSVCLPYLYGMQFALIEKTQAEASPRLNVKIGDRHAVAAMENPPREFARLIPKFTAHLNKLEQQGKLKAWMAFVARKEMALVTKRIAEVMHANDAVPTKRVKLLSFEEQGLFQMGRWARHGVGFGKAAWAMLFDGASDDSDDAPDEVEGDVPEHAAAAAEG